MERTSSNHPEPMVAPACPTRIVCPRSRAKPCHACSDCCAVLKVQGVVLSHLATEASEEAVMEDLPPRMAD